MKKQLIIKIYTDGKMEASTKNIKGKSCLKYIDIFKEMLSAEVVDSSFTKEYYENEIINGNEKIYKEEVKSGINNKG